MSALYEETSRRRQLKPLRRKVSSRRWNAAKSRKAPPAIGARVENHPGWVIAISGLQAEKLLRGQKPFTYVLRAGESSFNYYVTFTDRYGRVKHQPFIIIIRSEGWYYENGGYSGPFQRETIGDVVHMIMHAGCKEDCVSLGG